MKYCSTLRRMGSSKLRYYCCLFVCLFVLLSKDKMLWMFFDASGIGLDLFLDEDKVLLWMWYGGGMEVVWVCFWFRGN